MANNDSPYREDAKRDFSRVDALVDLVDALSVVEDELGFQVKRLNEHVKARTEEEAKYHDDLRQGYASAQTYVRRLRRYHEGRLDRQSETGNPGLDSNQSGGIVDGRATAHFGDD